MTWQEEGKKQQDAFYDKIEWKLSDGKPLTGFEKQMWRETGLVDYTEADHGEEKVIKYQE